MSSVAWLHLRKSWQLKHASFLTGLPTTGTKAELASLLGRALSRPVALTGRSRIVSIDMGIKNLGLCVVETVPSPSPAPRATYESSGKQRLRVVAWKKVNVLERAVLPSLGVNNDDDAADPVGEAASPTRPTVSNTFSPSALADIACSLTYRWLSTYNPDTILIERQRFRSGGAAAVQEWTLRVNMLESMLWASLMTVRNASLEDDAQSGTAVTFPALLEINPARVANFWCSSPSASTRQVPPDLLEHGTVSESIWQKIEKKKIEKKDKIAVVRSWLTAQAQQPSEVQLEFTEETRQISESFLAEARTGRRRAPGTGSARAEETVKLDDLADCLLQAVAWVKWEENRQAVRSLVETAMRTS